MQSITEGAPADVAASRLVAEPAAPPTHPHSSPAARSAGRSRAASLTGLSGPRLKKFLSYYRPHLGLLAADLGCAILVAATALALPLGANYVVKRLAIGGAHGAVVREIWTMGALMLGLIAAQALATLFVDYQGHVMGAKMESQLRRELFEHYQALSFGFYDTQRVGQLMSRISNDLFSLAELYHHGPEDLAIAVLKFAGASFILLRIDPPLTLLILGATPFAAAYALHFNGRMNAALRSAKVRIAAINERVEDSLSGIRVVKSFANEALEVARFEAENAAFLATRRFGYKAEAYFSVGLDTFAGLITVAVIVVGALRITHASLGIADLLTYLLCVGILVDPIKRAANFARSWQEGVTGFSRFMELLEVAPEVRDAAHARPLTDVAGEVALRGVSFHYPGHARLVLRDLDLEIAAGEFVALTGHSGVGKSTLCSLIPRFYDARQGVVTIDGIDVRDLTLASLRRAIGVVQQDVYLFAGTVAENLDYGRPGASRAEIVEAARHAQAHEFIMDLPRGYDTDIGQRGVKLSGGQKQRLTIARVFLKDPPVLIFDEATSALDVESERAIQAALQQLASGRTTLVIAHRLSTVRHADRIVVLGEDGVLEQGTHEALIGARGAYFALCEAQASI
ncbi:MAG TPA: ABC transporter ATP-binding protein [Caulobacteraceae bacterium]|jgi:ATP-binding cassette subfamily B protein|nr:ABC transporter ATP-binding protein [Caulobacteraceae bacterium]